MLSSDDDKNSEGGFNPDDIIQSNPHQIKENSKPNNNWDSGTATGGTGKFHDRGSKGESDEQEKGKKDDSSRCE
jgi:hypothetical protein